MTDRLNTLDELLSDPMVQLVMERDSVRPEQLRFMLERARDRAEEPRLPPAHVIEKVCLVKRLCL
jgi:hypothetical protein